MKTLDLSSNKKIVKKIREVFQDFDSKIGVYKKGAEYSIVFCNEDRFGREDISLSPSGLYSNDRDFGDKTLERVKEQFPSWDVSSWDRVGWVTEGNQYSHCGQWEILHQDKTNKRAQTPT